MNTHQKDKFTELAPWFHNLHLPDGSQTAPDHFLGDFPHFKWKQIAPFIDQDLTGWKVLDVGCNAGYYSFELAKRGADVFGIDVDPHYLTQARWAAKEYGLQNKTEFAQLQVYDLARTEQKFDLIWFMGVFYHLRYPLLALDILSQRAKNLMVFQTLSMPDNEVIETKADYDINEREDMLKMGFPKMAFIEKQLAGDPTNWWAANRACIEAMLRSCGMELMQSPEPETYICRVSSAFNSSLEDWNMSEYLSAIGRNWKTSIEKKTIGNNEEATK